MKPIRSFLFVPGNRASWIDKCPTAGADAVILDLEDSVPEAEKIGARALVAGKLARLLQAGQRTYVRINRSAHLFSFEDVMAVVQPGLEGIVLPMPNGPEDIALAAALVSEAEERNGVHRGSIGIVPALETPRSLQLAYECAQAGRVTALIGASAKNADLARAMGFVWSPDSFESLYLKSRTVMAARAAGKLPIGGIWQQVHDLEGLRQYATLNRKLGMSGEAILHPSNAAVVNAIFMPSEHDLNYYRKMVEAFEAGVAQGRASVMYAGEHIDAAHAQTARQIIEQGASYQGTGGKHPVENK
jgi:citrate lyase subunit beta / citryl-CoA lyase